MQRIEFTSKKQCPYCGNFNVEYIDLSDLLGTTHQDVIRIHTNKYVFKCNDCKELFYYTGVLELAEEQVDK